VAVWREVAPRLAHPERLAAEYQRRLHPASPTTPPALAPVEAHLGKLRQGVARLLDSYADGLIDKQAFEPRILRLRRRIAQGDAQRQQLVDDATLQTALPLIIGRVDAFASKVQNGLNEADWEQQRDFIRALVKRVEIARDDVNLVFRIDPYPSDMDPEKKVCHFVGRESSLSLANTCTYIRAIHLNPNQLSMPSNQFAWRGGEAPFASSYAGLSNGVTASSKKRSR
jgi:site-specific DNA recombinase